MYYSPFSIVLKYEVPDGKGVYALPHTLAIPGGWGEPRKTPEGEPIKPGTPNGPHPYGYVRVKDDEYKFTATQNFQKSGCISWWGKAIDPEDATKGNFVLSYHGPKLRYFKDPSFNYGDSGTHNEVYCKGSYAAVAPAPVLGACLTTVGIYSADDEKYLPVVCVCAAVYENGKDVFYYKPFTGLMPPGMTDGTRALAIQLYQEDKPETANGWRLLGSVPRQSTNHFPPETPWFFNESGSEASCLRRRNITFNNGKQEVTESCFDLFTVAIRDTGITANKAPTMAFGNYGNKPPYEYKEYLTKVRPEVYVSTDQYDVDHEWQEDHVFVTVEFSGKQYVLVDYVGDEKILGTLDYDIQHIQKEYFTIGIDLPGWPYSNNGSTTGPLPIPVPPTEANHAWTQWINVYENIMLYIGPPNDEERTHIQLHYYETGTSNGWAGMPEEPNNPYIYFLWYVTRRFRGVLDVRRDNTTFVQDYLRYALSLGSDNFEQHERFIDVLYSKYGDADTGTQTIVIGEVPHSSPWLETENGKQYLIINNPLGNGSLAFGWVRSDMETWDESFDETLTRINYTGERSADNWEGEEIMPGSNTFYAGDTLGFIHDRKWPNLADLLYGPNTLCEGNGVATDKGEVGFSMRLTNPVGNDTEFFDVADHLPAGKLTTLITYGEQFHPIGSC